MNRDDRLGSVEVGKYADFIVLDRNLFEVEVTETVEDVADRHHYLRAAYAGDGTLGAQCPGLKNAGSTGWYRRELELADPLPPSVRLVFEGINYRADVWLNGKPVASAPSFSRICSTTFSGSAPVRHRIR